MCFVSAVMQQFEPHVPYRWPSPLNQTSQRDYSAEELGRLLRAFRQAYEAAEEFDKLTGQPDCVDPEKAKLEERVEMLEKKLEELADARS